MIGVFRSFLRFGFLNKRRQTKREEKSSEWTPYTVHCTGTLRTKHLFQLNIKAISAQCKHGIHARLHASAYPSISCYSVAVVKGWTIAIMCCISLCIPNILCLSRCFKLKNMNWRQNLIFIWKRLTLDFRNLVAGKKVLLLNAYVWLRRLEYLMCKKQYSKKISTQMQCEYHENIYMQLQQNCKQWMNFVASNSILDNVATSWFSLIYYCKIYYFANTSSFRFISTEWLKNSLEFIILSKNVAYEWILWLNSYCAHCQNAFRWMNKNH